MSALDENKPAEVPLIEQLLSVPEEARISWEFIGVPHGGIYPFGYLCHKAAAELAQLRAENERQRNDIAIEQRKADLRLEMIDSQNKSLNIMVVENGIMKGEINACHNELAQLRAAGGKMKPIKPTCHNCFYKEIREVGEWCYMFDDKPGGNPPLCMKWEWTEAEANSEDAEEDAE